MKKTPKHIIILHKCTKNHDHKLYCSWDMVCDGCNCYFSFWAIFYPFNPTRLTAQKNENIEKIWTKETGDIIILLKCTKNHDHRLYCSCDQCNYFSFWAIFCPFTPITAPKMETSKQWKKSLEISSFHRSVPKLMIICYTVPEIRCVTNVIVVFHFGLFFCPFTPWQPKNENFKKMWKKKTPGDIIILHNCT